MSDLVEILRRVEVKIDNIGPQEESNALRQTSTPTASRPEQLRTRSFGNGGYSSLSMQRDLFHELQKASTHLTVPHKVLLWPRIYSDLMASPISAAFDMPSILNEALSAGNGLPAIAVNISDRTSGHMPNIIFPTLAPEQVQKSTAHYFETFNLLYPILDFGCYMREINEQILREGHRDGDAKSVIMLLVLALGQISTDGIAGAPISIIEGQASGFRGGSAESPPGLAAFNEARRRFGFISTDCTIETVQALLLQSIYYESHARHIDYWRCITSASLALQGLLKVQHIDWATFHGDQVKRAFWASVVQENLFYIDLDLPGTELRKLVDVVPLPHFHEWQDDVQGAAPEVSWIFHGQFLAMIALHAIISRIHEVIYASEASVSRAGSPSDTSVLPVFVVHELARQLNTWQRTLPRPLQWPLNDGSDFAHDERQIRPLDEPKISNAMVSASRFEQLTYGIATAQLRTRFYYARFMLYRPFVYKALHSPEKMTVADGGFCALAIQSACRWPLAMDSAKDQKRLFPHLFAWTQTSIGTLLILRMASKSDCLRYICDEQVDFHEIHLATSILLDWLRDMKQLDGIAEWACTMMDELFPRAERERQT